MVIYIHDIGSIPQLPHGAAETAVFDSFGPDIFIKE
jgi:hypothetical protein